MKNKEFYLPTIERALVEKPEEIILLSCKTAKKQRMFLELTVDSFEEENYYDVKFVKYQKDKSNGWLQEEGIWMMKSDPDFDDWMSFDEDVADYLGSIGIKHRIKVIDCYTPAESNLSDYLINYSVCDVHYDTELSNRYLLIHEDEYEKDERISLIESILEDMWIVKPKYSSLSETLRLLIKEALKSEYCCANFDTEDLVYLGIKPDDINALIKEAEANGMELCFEWPLTTEGNVYKHPDHDSIEVFAGVHSALEFKD